MKQSVVDTPKHSQKLVDLCNVGYNEPKEVLQEACASDTSDSPKKTTRSPHGCRENVLPLQSSSSSDDYTSSSNDEGDDDERANFDEGYEEAES